MDYRLLQAAERFGTHWRLACLRSVLKESRSSAETYTNHIEGSQVNRLRVSIWVIVVLVLSAVVVPAQTVMVYVSGTSQTDEYLLSAVEAGVMDSFFDAGFIVFNAGTYQRVSESEIQRRYWIRNTARQGGATHAIEVNVDLVVYRVDALIPDTASYVLVTVEPAEVLLSGRISAGQLTGLENRSAAQVGFRIGVEIAQSAIARM
jgi:hypothetical protein